MDKKIVTEGNVTYTYKSIYEPPQQEEWHGIHILGDYTYLEIESIMLDINGDGIEILNQINKETLEQIYIHLENINFNN